MTEPKFCIGDIVESTISGYYLGIHGEIIGKAQVSFSWPRYRVRLETPDAKEIIVESRYLRKVTP